MSFETPVLIVIFIAAAYFAYKYFVKEHFTAGCSGTKTGCSCGDKKNGSLQKFLEIERKRREAEDAPKGESGG